MTNEYVPNEFEERISEDTLEGIVGRALANKRADESGYSDEEGAELAITEAMHVERELRRAGLRIVKPAPESFVRKINGREAIVIESEL